jgi:hypothetical protein
MGGGIAELVVADVVGREDFLKRRCGRVKVVDGYLNAINVLQHENLHPG